MPYHQLNPDEQRVIVRKGTEAPFSGEYETNQDVGTYICKRCQAPLYQSVHKFDARCGWPSFDQEIEAAVKRTMDADGSRIETTCTHCGAHLGHVFEGEGLTKTNIRHCVNSISMSFIPENQAIPDILNP